MSIVNIDKIINGTPEKKLLNGYNVLRQDYTEASAQDYYEIYKNEPLSFMLESSRLIFSEAYCGYKYYKESIEDTSNCVFYPLESEIIKVQNYLDEQGSNMSDEQRLLYESLQTSITDVLEHTKNTRLYSYYIKENIDEKFENTLSDLLFEYENNNDEKDIVSLMESVDNPVVYFTYAPYVMNKIGSTSLYNKTAKMFKEAAIPECYDEDKWRNFVETTVCCNKLSNDDVYVEAVNNILNKEVKILFEYFMNTSLDDKLAELVEEKVSKDILHSSPVLAVNSLFDDMYESAIDAEELSQEKNEINIYKAIAYESTLDIIISEYQHCKDVSNSAEGYSLIKESMTIEEAFESITSLYNETNISYISEANEEDEEDDVDTEDVPDEKEKEVGNAGKKIKAPKPKNLANKVQFKAMDAEAKQMKKSAIRKQKGQEIGNAFKAVVQMPKNALDSIKQQVRLLDKADDGRRKDYMTEPGFRKKAFRNLKLALLYGSAAKVKLSLMPVVAITRHFSKMKDVRMRNELVREISTEIKICEEKILDANSRGDMKEKYRLMRIKDQLDAELVRVKVNSKYV